MTSTARCVVCRKPTADGYACAGETRKAAGQLAEIAELTPAARAIAYGQSRTGTSGGSAGKPGPRMELNLAAGARMDAVQARLWAIARHIAETRGVALP